MANIGTILANLDRWEQAERDNLEARLVKILLDLEAQAKTDHPYTDRTGANTASIQGFVRTVTSTEIVGVLTATMAYSAALELSKGGKYAYLWPTIERNRDTIISALSG